MNIVLFQIGAVLVILSLVLWLVFRLDNIVNISDRELAVFLILGGFLMLSELLYQLQQFFTSGAPPENYPPPHRRNPASSE